MYYETLALHSHDSTSERQRGSPGRLPGTGSPGSGLADRGGYRNPVTGAGGLSDRGEHGFFTPTRIYSKWGLESLYVEPWAARKFLDIPVDDMLIRWRRFLDELDEAAAQAMREAEERHRVQDKLAQVIKAGRLYGSAFLVMATMEAPLNEPLAVERVRPGDLKNLLVFDRYDTSIVARDPDPFSPTYGEPLSYSFTGRGSPTLVVHASRVLRFDGLRPLSVTGWQALRPGLGRLGGGAGDSKRPAGRWYRQRRHPLDGRGQRSGWSRCTTSKRPWPKAASRRSPTMWGPDTMGEEINRSRSIYRTLFLDSEDEFERVAVTFAGLSELMDQFARRLAAADIPATRFWGQSPVGLNATGESDMRNYALRVAAMQKAKLRPPVPLGPGAGARLRNRRAAGIRVGIPAGPVRRRAGRHCQGQGGSYGSCDSCRIPGRKRGPGRPEW